MMHPSMVPFPSLCRRLASHMPPTGYKTWIEDGEGRGFRPGRARHAFAFPEGGEGGQQQQELLNCLSLLDSHGRRQRPGRPTGHAAAASSHGIRRQPSSPRLLRVAQAVAPGTRCRRRHRGVVGPGAAMTDG